MKPLENHLAEQLRAAIRASGHSQNELGKRSGVPQQKISDFLAGRDMRLKSASKLARALGLRLR